MKSMVFKGFNLQSSPYKVVEQDNLFSSPVLDIITHELARSDNAVSVYRRYKSRDFTLRGNIQTSSEAELESAIDALKVALVRQQGDLVTEWAGSSRYFNAECKQVMIARGTADVDRCGWSAPFHMDVPFSTDNTTRDFITDVSGHTTNSLTVATSNLGTYLAAPFFTITLTAIEPNTSDVGITLANPSTSESITITDTFADGDVITVDVLNGQIFRGTELLAGVGNFPEWLPGSGLLEYTDTATSRTISLEAEYKARYL